MNKFKLILSIFFLALGLVCAVLTYTDATYTQTNTKYREYREYPDATFKEYHDGIAIGLGIISGFSFLSSVLLLNSFNKSNRAYL